MSIVEQCTIYSNDAGYTYLYIIYTYSIVGDGSVGWKPYFNDKKNKSSVKT